LPIALLFAAPLFAQCGSCQSCGTGGASSRTIGSFNVQLPTLAGDTFDLGSKVGATAVVLFHIGSDSFSDKATGLVAQTAKDNPDIVVVATLCDTSAKARKHVKGLKLSLPVMLDPDGAQLAFCQQNECTPAAIFLNGAGDVVLNTSEITEETMKQGLEAIAAAVQIVDPVCGMTVDRAKAAGSYEYKGATYYFCSANCRNRFIKSPAQYVK
jgi:YHS domain-containing protein